jgi:uncharacterized protein with von Willebrand factor type A (vWA) domain
MTFSRPDNQSRAPIKFGAAAALLHDQHRQQNFDEGFAPVFRRGRPAILSTFCQKS